MGPQRRLREFTWEHPIAKRFAAENFPSPVKRGLQNGGFRKLRGLNVNFLFSNPEKAHPSAELRRLRGLSCGALEEPKKEAE